MGNQKYDLVSYISGDGQALTKTRAESSPLSKHLSGLFDHRPTPAVGELSESQAEKWIQRELAGLLGLVEPTIASISRDSRTRSTMTEGTVDEYTLVVELDGDGYLVQFWPDDLAVEFAAEDWDHEPAGPAHPVWVLDTDCTHLRFTMTDNSATSLKMFSETDSKLSRSGYQQWLRPFQAKSQPPNRRSVTGCWPTTESALSTRRLGASSQNP